MPVYTYPKRIWTTFFFKHWFPSIRTRKPKVAEAFQYEAGVSDAQLRSAFRFGDTPRFVEKKLVKRYAESNPGSRDISLSKDFVDELEAALSFSKPSWNGKYHAPTYLQGDIFLVLEATVLHEMVHFFQASSALTSVQYTREESKARRFENKAYGKQHMVSDGYLRKYFPKTSLIQRH
ncbi:zincin-like metallopeptidase toxin 3 of polymorphic toxin system [Litoreibacter halocynthiae]|uniref:Zincin-like metallopeptidase toxin 3 of polymorphic toxin system n=1 Tax=Litoreibacter halocynthiae TaxID=1242689 RepID=A0A4R7LKA3_9RHOB|nr:hypothetical protein [Litoreibacter halocynthiae]TDT74831.1 zincin-like metallopeptidase toxin 3 of polymorphic toxin system [Litoreibacter halocynthiae]